MADRSVDKRRDQHAHRQHCDQSLVPRHTRHIMEYSRMPFRFAQAPGEAFQITAIAFEALPSMRKSAAMRLPNALTRAPPAGTADQRL